VDAQHLEAARLVGHADVDLAIEAPEAAQRRVDRVGAVGFFFFGGCVGFYLCVCFRGVVFVFV